jgi:hypothetical protein
LTVARLPDFTEPPGAALHGCVFRSPLLPQGQFLVALAKAL